MKVAISGASGLIGGALRRSLTTDGHEVLAISRRRSLDSVQTVTWNVAEDRLDPGPLEGVDAVVHLAGEPIARRWSASVKRAIRSSRIEGTRLLLEGLAQLERKPEVLVSASAVGFYGDRGDSELDETSPAGDDFLAEVCEAWESTVLEARQLGIRTVPVRIGVVLSTRGGALGKMLLPFRLCLGGPVGGGRQWMSWIHIDDLVSLFRLVIEREDLAGAVNGTAPNPVRNAELTKELGRALHRPAVLPLPATVLQLAFGEMSQILLTSQRVAPRRALEAGMDFRHPDLAEALRHLLEHGR